MLATIVDVLAVTVTAGLMGNELAIGAFVHPILSRLDDGCHSRAAQQLARINGRMMPFWYAGAVVLSFAMLAVRPPGSPSWLLTAVAATLLIGSVAFTLVGLQSINRRVAHWDLSALPAEWRHERATWDRRHRIRIALLMLATLLLAASVAVD